MSEPVWKRPIWTTIIASIVSVVGFGFQQIGNYLDLEGKKIELESKQLDNDVKLQNSQFAVVDKILVQEGNERLVTLRFVAGTSTNLEARQWAKEEIKIIKELNKLEFEKKKSIQNLSLNKSTVDGEDNIPPDLFREMLMLSANTQIIGSELELAWADAGYKQQKRNAFSATVLFKSGTGPSQNITISGLFNDVGITSLPQLCGHNSQECIFITDIGIPDVLNISSKLVKSVYAVYTQWGTSTKIAIKYVCNKENEFTVCNRVVP